MQKIMANIFFFWKTFLGQLFKKWHLFALLYLFAASISFVSVFLAHFLTGNKYWLADAIIISGVNGTLADFIFFAIFVANFTEWYNSDGFI